MQQDNEAPTAAEKVMNILLYTQQRPDTPPIYSVCLYIQFGVYLQRNVTVIKRNVASYHCKKGLICSVSSGVSHLRVNTNTNIQSEWVVPERCLCPVCPAHKGFLGLGASVCPLRRYTASHIQKHDHLQFPQTESRK